jgi:hypothetical protein
MTMNLEETVKLITWVNQHDARVQVNGPSRDIWAHSMAPYTAGEARQAVLDHYRINDTETVTPAIVRKRAEIVRNARAGFQSAVTAGGGPEVTDPMTWRKRNPERWDELMREGAAERRRALGLPMDAA